MALDGTSLIHGLQSPVSWMDGAGWALDSYDDSWINIDVC
jgi:hypothetical protein